MENKTKQNLIYSINYYTERIQTLKDFYNEDNPEGKQRIKALKETRAILRKQLKEI